MSRDCLVRAEVGRRRILGRSASLGALTLLTGCDVTNTDAVQGALRAISRWNDEVQAALFGGKRLARTFPESAIANPYRYNAYYSPKEVPRLDPATYRLELAGLIADKRPWTVADIYGLPRETQITRHVCVEGWSYIGKWSGPRLSDFLAPIGADTKAQYIGYECADGYYGSIDIATALHPQTILAVTGADGPLTPEYGYPFKTRILIKLGFKNPKFVSVLYLTNRFPGGFWEDRGYNWFAGI
jgi:DMSO/TMAO reductase YedYZ molybdopterin-dependent catalytic subunit